MLSTLSRSEWEDLDQDHEVDGVILEEERIENKARESPVWNVFDSLTINPLERPSTEQRKTFCSNILASNEVLQRAKESEINFGMCAQSKQLQWFEASDIEDMRHHTDCYLQSDGSYMPRGLYPIDVKAYKPISAKKKVQTQYLWLEVHSKGFVFSGLSTCIAVQYMPHKFVLLHKKALQAFVRSKISNLRPVVRNKQALYRLYRREEKKDEWLTLVDFLDCVGSCAVTLL